MIQYDPNSVLSDALERRLISEAIREEMSFKPLVSLKALLAKLKLAGTAAHMEHTAPSGQLRSSH